MSDVKLVADVFDLQVDTNDGDLFATNTLDSSGINVSADGDDVVAGQGASIIARLNSARRVTISVNDKTMNWDFIQMNLGKKFASGATTVMAPPKYYTAETDSDNVVLNLDHEPLASNSKLKIVELSTGKVLKTPSDYTITSKKVTLIGGVAGDKYRVIGYFYTSEGTAESLTITDNTFPQGCSLILTTLEVDHRDKPVNYVQIQIDNAMPDGNFELNLVAQRTINGTPMTFTAVRPEGSNGDLGKVVRIPIASS